MVVVVVVMGELIKGVLNGRGLDGKEKSQMGGEVFLWKMIRKPVVWTLTFQEGRQYPEVRVEVSGGYKA